MDGAGTARAEWFVRQVASADGLWGEHSQSRRLPPDVGLIGTADHGLAEFAEDKKLLVRERQFDQLRFAGDSRGLQMWGDESLMNDLVERTGGELADPADFVGPDPTGPARARLGEKVLIPPDDIAVIPKGFDKRLRCYHGGLSRAEVEIPLLIA